MIITGSIVKSRSKSNNGNTCPKSYSEENINKNFPLPGCDGCHFRIYDDEEGFMYCGRKKGS